jgi:hypothetical protein
LFEASQNAQLPVTEPACPWSRSALPRSIAELNLKLWIYSRTARKDLHIEMQVFPLSVAFELIY